jgi:hypothetical protein
MNETIGEREKKKEGKRRIKHTQKRREAAARGS